MRTREALMALPVSYTHLDVYKRQKYGFFSRAGFACEPGDELIFIDLPELYAG